MTEHPFLSVSSVNSVVPLFRILSNRPKSGQIGPTNGHKRPQNGHKMDTRTTTPKRRTQTPTTTWLNRAPRQLSAPPVFQTHAPKPAPLLASRSCKPDLHVAFLHHTRPSWGFP